MLTQRILDRLQVGQTKSDGTLAGFEARRNADDSITFYVRREVKDGAGKRRTEKVSLTDASLDDARKWAKRTVGDWQDKPLPVKMTLRTAWEDFKRWHLGNRGKAERTVDWYEDQITRVLGDWLDKPMAKLGSEDFRPNLKRRHAAIAEEVRERRAANAAKRKGRNRKAVEDRRAARNKKADDNPESGKVAADQAMMAFRAVYRYAYADHPQSLPPLGPFNFLYRPKSRKKGVGDIAAWWKQLEAMEGKPVRQAFHALCLLTGSRAGAMSKARWEHLNVAERRWHVPAPKGGEDRAFDMPMSREILRWLRKARVAAEREGTGKPACHPWIFPSRISKSGHLEAWPELPETLRHVAHDLRRTYRSFANRRATKLEAKLLMNHALSDDVTDGYADPALLWPDLLAAQERISKSLCL